MHVTLQPVNDCNETMKVCCVAYDFKNELLAFQIVGKLNIK